MRCAWDGILLWVVRLYLDLNFCWPLRYLFRASWPLKCVIAFGQHAERTDWATARGTWCSMLRLGAACFVTATESNEKHLRQQTADRGPRRPRSLIHDVSTENFGRAYSEAWAAYFTH
jgi:hypothetical protein